MLKNLGVKAKLIILFVFIKIIPLIIVSYLAIIGVNTITSSFLDSLEKSTQENIDVIQVVAKDTIEDSIKALDKTSQIFYEKLTLKIASQIAQFLYERDDDIRFLSTLNPSNTLYKNFVLSKQKAITIPPKYRYDDKTSSWITQKQQDKTLVITPIEDNKKNFHIVHTTKLHQKKIPIYKEISFFDTKGKELYKYSTINSKLLDISHKKNTYIHSETYFDKIQNLKKGEIYVSDVVGRYVGSKLIGTFSKEKAKKLGIAFEPEKYGYAGKENPVGKKFEGIVRFVMPIYKKNKKIGYISLALDHKHIMEFTDSFSPTKQHLTQTISNASDGNYAFLWDHKFRCISHPRDYFISGFDPKTGKRVTPWVSKDIVEKFHKSTYKDLDQFLAHYPTFDNQSSQKKPNIAQLKEGDLSLDCKYLNFAPQCTGWKNIVQNDAFGSFEIYWSKVWKLTTVAPIPYYTGQYSNYKQGFGFVTIGTNVADFHKAANKTKEKIDTLIKKQEKSLKEYKQHTQSIIKTFINGFITQLTVVTFLLSIIVVLIAIYLANYLTKKIKKLIYATKELANGNFDIKLKMNSQDELGELAKSFQDTVDKMKALVDEKNSINQHLEEKIALEVEKNRIQHEKIIQQSRLAQMGEMISMIAHQWRQPLTAISATCGSLYIKAKMGKLSTSKVIELSTKITEYSEHLSSTINDFRDFFKPHKHTTDTTCDELIESTLNIIEVSLENKNIEIVKELNSKTVLHTYVNEVKHVILNLIKNAEDILIEKKIENPKITIITKNNTITIKDNAGGIPKEILPKIFDPYFSTKSEKNGTGLGLYMSKMIIEDHCNSTLKATNDKYGAVFTIDFNQKDKV